MAAVNGHLLAVATAVLLLLLLLFSTATSDPSDELCLTHLHQSFNSNLHLQNWTKSTFSNPCQGFTSFLQGATCNNGRIYKLTLPNLSLSGSISPHISNCTNLQTLDLSSNSLTGQIPIELQYLVNLAVLNLSYNTLNGPIPPQLAMCAYLNVIDLHNNELSGPIPQQLGLLVRLSVFDVSDNRMSGMIMGNLGRRFNLSSFEGNKGLFGYPMKEMRESKGMSVMEIVGIGLASGFGSLAISFTAVCVWLRLTEKRFDEEDDDRGKVNHEGMPDY